MKKTDIAVAAVTALLLCACAPSSADLQFEGVSVLTEEAASTTEASEEAVVEEVPTGTFKVYVCGAVEQPGVYELPAGSRIVDALEQAGGVTEDGVPTALNFAEIIYDGEQIQVPTWDEYNAGWTGNDNAAESESGLVNINTATKEQLMTLNGIGESRAQAIIAYREEHGPFSAIEDLMQVSGIKEAAFEKVKDDITVN